MSKASASPLKWRLEVFNSAGEVIGQLSRTADGPPVISGMAEDLAFAAHEAGQVPAFLTDPDTIGRAAYNAWREHVIRVQLAAKPAHVVTPMTWEDRKADPTSAEIIDRWIAIGKAARACDPTCN